MSDKEFIIKEKDLEKMLLKFYHDFGTFFHGKDMSKETLADLFEYINTWIFHNVKVFPNEPS